MHAEIVGTREGSRVRVLHGLQRCSSLCTFEPKRISQRHFLAFGWNNRDGSFPPGVVNTVPSLGPVGGAALASHMDVDKVAFTGSTVTGRKIMEAAAKSNLKKVNFLCSDDPPVDAVFSGGITTMIDAGIPRAWWQISAHHIRVGGLGTRCDSFLVCVDIHA